MGRKRIVTRDAILDAAEEVIRNSHGHQLSLQLVAEAANITKGSIAHNFRTKDELLLAVYARESARFESEAASVEGAAETVMRERDLGSPHPCRDPVDRIAGWISATRRENEAMIMKAANLLIHMLPSEPRREMVAASYERMLEGIDTGTPEGRAAFVAFMAVEGLFLLRGLGLLQLSEAQWQNYLDTIRDECLT